MLLETRQAHDTQHEHDNVLPSHNHLATSKDDEMPSHIVYNSLHHFKLDHVSVAAGHGVQVK